MKLKGIIPPMVTPLSSGTELDKEGTIRLTEHLIAGGVHGLFVLGTTGEAQGISYSLRCEFVELVCRQNAGRLPVLVGITDTCIEDSVRLAAHAKKCGAVGVVAAAPYYFGPSQVEAVEYFEALADAVELPLYLYNIPSRVKVNLDVDTVVKLSHHPNIVGVKDSSGNMGYFDNLLYKLGGREDFAIYIGMEELTGEAVVLGSDGGINGGANMFPHLYVAMYEAAEAGDLQRIREIQPVIMEVCEKIYNVGRYGGSSYLKGLKAALKVLGICDDYLAYPYRKFQTPEFEKIKAAIAELTPKVLAVDPKL